MKSTRNTIVALVTAIFACSVSIAEEYLDTTETRAVATEQSASYAQLLARDYLDANWTLFTGDSEDAAEVDSLMDLSEKYFDANWALFERRYK